MAKVGLEPREELRDVKEWAQEMPEGATIKVVHGRRDDDSVTVDALRAEVERVKAKAAADVEGHLRAIKERDDQLVDQKLKYQEQILALRRRVVALQDRLLALDD